jgi:hypothetical protein
MATYPVNSDLIDNTAFIVQKLAILTADCAVDRVTYGNLQANISDALFEVPAYKHITCATYLVLEAVPLLHQLPGKNVRRC